MQQPYSTGIDVDVGADRPPYPHDHDGRRIDDPSVGDAYKVSNRRLTGKTLPTSTRAT